MSNLKEAILVLKHGKYEASHESDLDLLKKYLNPDIFIDKIGKCIYEEPDFAKFRKWLRITRIVQLVVGILTSLYILAFVVSMIADISGGKKDPYEYMFLGFCIVLMLFMMTTILIVYVEATKLRKSREVLLKRIRTQISEGFDGCDCGFLVNLDRSMTLRVRPIDNSANDSENQNMDIETMDYYDYITYHNPSDDDYYTKNNPYELDPHEKNLMADVIKRREKELENESKKGRKFKFLSTNK